MKLRLVEDWRNAWRWLSVNCMVVAGSIQGAWLALTDEQRASLPPNVIHYVTGAVLLLGVLGRLVQQAPKTPPAEGGSQ